MGLRQGRYRHFKGAEYEVKGLATHSETGEKLVVYSPLYGEGGLWVRPLTMFLETVEHEGKPHQRFEYVGDAVP
jgi:cyclomaltodextrinase